MGVPPNCQRYDVHGRACGVWETIPSASLPQRLRTQTRFHCLFLSFGEHFFAVLPQLQASFPLTLLLWRGKMGGGFLSLSLQTV